MEKQLWANHLTVCILILNVKIFQKNKYQKHFILAYPKPLTGSVIYQNKTMAVLIKTALKTTKKLR